MISKYASLIIVHYILLHTTIHSWNFFINKNAAYFTFYESKFSIAKREFLKEKLVYTQHNTSTTRTRTLLQQLNRNDYT